MSVQVLSMCHEFKLLIDINDDNTVQLRQRDMSYT